MLDIQKLRADTPGCENVLHLNNAGAALMPKPVIDSYKGYIDNEAMMGGYETARAFSSELESFYDCAAALIRAKPTEIAFTNHATQAWDFVFTSLPLKAGDCILTSRAEYVSNYISLLHRQKQIGFEIKIIEDDETGAMDLKDLERNITPKVKLISATHVPTQGGLVNPVVEIGKIAKHYNIPYLVDTTQSIGQMPVDVNNLQCDFLCATGRKFLRGPRGTGFLYIRQEKLGLLNPSHIDLRGATWTSPQAYKIRDDAKCFEYWEQNYAAKLGLKAAIEYALKLELPVIWERIQFLAAKLRALLQILPGLTLRDLGVNPCGIVTFTHPNMDVRLLQEKLHFQKINVSITEQEFAQLDLGRRNIKAMIRVSVHYYNTEDEIVRFVEILEQFIKTGLLARK